MSVSFTLEKRTNLHDESPIRISWSFMGERLQSTLGVSIKKEDWNEKSRLVKADAHNHNGQSANEINLLIKRISVDVMDIELACIENGYILGKDMMKQAISDALANDIARPEDIVERCINGIVSTPEPTTRYYRATYLVDIISFYAMPETIIYQVINTTSSKNYLERTKELPFQSASLSQKEKREVCIPLQNSRK